MSDDKLPPDAEWDVALPRPDALNGLDQETVLTIAKGLIAELQEARRRRNMYYSVMRSMSLPEGRRMKPTGRVYFIRAASSLIKIGFSHYPKGRMAELQTAHWGRLELLAEVPGSKKDEHALHARFKAARAEGEWFRPVHALLAHIESLRGH